jgi:type I restriction enzyme M protein
MSKLSLAKLERHLYSAADRLRQEGLDAATYKDYIFGMLFLKRCSDVFDAEREKIVGTRIEQGMAKEKAEGYDEDPDYYDGFFVPERARWVYLQDKLGDAKEPYGSVLDKALGALAERNETLEHVLDHISFMRVQSNKRIVSDDACKDLVRHFSKYRLRNEDFQFSDLLGSAYEFLINMFAESAGKKGGDFYTPRDVIRLMVRILKPKPGLSVYDPCCGSGGMLIISREFIEQSGGDVTNLRLCGQVNDASAWSICKLNMLLHGVPGADIRLEDTLLHPMHREAGELERFDRVIANPPFSQNYSRTNMEYPERFRWGWAPTTGKKGDLMFAEHMLAVCKPGGMVTTVMPHRVLFRGGAETRGCSGRVDGRDLGYRWGSCGKNGVVYFNWKLLQLPARIADYVIAHELAHLLEPHHGPGLWRILDRSLPDRRDRSEELKVKARDIYWCNDRMKNR